ncbi:hypothetical protein [Elstera sp.]|jgi:hypothetical protein|uniref:hypothetical protein n=1 Tax=Elstera sp. TaxID=1916664 RepID=UPI0037BEB326
MFDLFNNPAIDPTNVIPFPAKLRPHAVPLPKMHPLTFAVIELSQADRYEWAVNNLFVEPVDDPDAAEAYARANISMHGVILIDALVRPALVDYPGLTEWFPITLEIAAIERADLEARVPHPYRYL